MSGQSISGVANTGNSLFLKTVAAISTFAGWVSAGMITLAVLITCQMIFIRFVLNGSTIWQTEAVIYLMIAATLVGLPYVQRLRGHVNVDLIPIALPMRLRRGLAIVTLAVSALIIAVMLWYGYEFWHIAYARGWKSDTVWSVALWKPYMALPVGLGLLLLQLIADLYAVIIRVDAPFGIEQEGLAARVSGDL